MVFVFFVGVVVVFLLEWLLCFCWSGCCVFVGVVVFFLEWLLELC